MVFENHLIDLNPINFRRNSNFDAGSGPLIFSKKMMQKNYDSTQVHEDNYDFCFATAVESICSNQAQTFEYWVSKHFRWNNHRSAAAFSKVTPGFSTYSGPEHSTTRAN